MHSVRSNDGVELSYRVFGTGPETLVFVHGWMASGAVWDRVLPLLDTRGRRMIVPDLRGTGSSGKTGPFTLPRFAADLLAVLDHADASQATWVGHSMGGQLVQWVGAHHADRVRAAAALCPVPAAGIPLPDDARGLFRTAGRDRNKLGTILAMACKALPDDERDALLDDAHRIAPECIAETFDAWSAGGFADKLGAFTAPLLVLATDDPFTPPDFLRESIVRRVGHGRLAVLPGPGHYPQVEKPRETAAVLEAFLAAL